MRHISILLQQIEQVFGTTPNSPTQFEALAKSIFDTTHEPVSVSTLKRLWGYVPTDSDPRPTTLDILARYVGTLDWSTFTQRCSGTSQPTESNPITGAHLDASTLTIGRRVRVLWAPDRMCIFRCTGPSQFIVEESQNSKLSIGDTFTCHTFIPNQPLYLTNLMMAHSTAPVSYVCGRNNGVKLCW